MMNDQDVEDDLDQAESLKERGRNIVIHTAFIVAVISLPEPYGAIVMYAFVMLMLYETELKNWD
jgi:Sec-independent protein secretion pathway component TatC